MGHQALGSPNPLAAKPWEHPTLGTLNPRGTKLWGHQIPVPPRSGVTKSFGHQTLASPNLAATKPCSHQTLQPPNPEVTKPWVHQNLRSPSPEATKPLGHRALGPPNPRALTAVALLLGGPLSSLSPAHLGDEELAGGELTPGHLHLAVAFHLQVLQLPAPLHHRLHLRLDLANVEPGDGELLLDGPAHLHRLGTGTAHGSWRGVA